MVDGSLSQEEIDLLLQGADSDSISSGSSSASIGSSAGLGADMSPIEQATISDMITQALSSSAEGVGMMIGKNVHLGDPYPETVSLNQLQGELNQRQVAFVQNISGSLSGQQAIFIPMPDVIRIAAIPMGNEDTVDTEVELDEAQSATARELIGPMGYNMATQMAARTGVSLTPMPVETHICNGANPFPLRSPDAWLKIQIPFKIEGSVDSRMIVALPLDLAARVYQELQNKSRGAQVSMESEGSMPQQPTGPLPGQTGVKDVNFPSLSTHGSGPLQPNMNLLLDVQMTMTVELGRTKMYIKDILALGEGSIIELEKLAGEPVDMLVNGKLIAKGEVVVIDENFGVRVTDIVKPIERLSPSAGMRS
ncbi:MAG: flagellar motor switch protein FliN [Leptospiraceae bacterium]|nr:flagellar motor switch protein FliN [Leptospiraceae bacterium]